MSDAHDILATKIGNTLLQKIRDQESEWKQIFSSTINRVGDWDWPRPDFVCEDRQLKATYALEFKPPNQSKREYLTGLGQALSYLQRHNYSGLIVPSKSVDNFPIADFIRQTLSTHEFKDISISLIQYDVARVSHDVPSSLSLSRAITHTRASKTAKAKRAETFWLWWRDLSNFELFQLLELSDHFRGEPGDIYTSHIFRCFWGLMNDGKTLTWDKKRRYKSGTSYNSEKQNYKIPLFQLDLWDQAEGRLTVKGYKLLTIGKMYGAESKEFMDYLTYLVLIDGKHLELINEISEWQRANPSALPATSKQFFLEAERYLDSKGYIGSRKPGRKTTGAKNSYLRDEPKLWSKLGLLKVHGANYFRPHNGLEFNWNRITQILRGTNSDIFS
jgi:hypothetical protein